MRQAPARAIALGLLLMSAAGCTNQPTEPPQIPPTVSPPHQSTTPQPRPQRVSLKLLHCGPELLEYAGETWEAQRPPPFDATNAPAKWRGTGAVSLRGTSELIYRDDSGIELTFLPEAQVPPYACA